MELESVDICLEEAKEVLEAAIATPVDQNSTKLLNQASIENLTGHINHFFRPPGGLMTPVQLIDVIENAGEQS